MTAPAKKTNRLVGASLRRKEDPRSSAGRGQLCRRSQAAGNAARRLLPQRCGPCDGLDPSMWRGCEGGWSRRRLYRARIRAFIAPAGRASNSNASYQQSEMPILARDKVIYVGQPSRSSLRKADMRLRMASMLSTPFMSRLPSVLDIEARLRRTRRSFTTQSAGNAYNHFHVAHGDIEKALLRGGSCRRDGISPQSLRRGPARRAGRARRLGPSDKRGRRLDRPSGAASFRTAIAEVFGLNKSDVRVISPDVGGGFGVKLAFYPEDAATLPHPGSSAVLSNGRATGAKT